MKNFFEPGFMKYRIISMNISMLIILFFCFSGCGTFDREEKKKKYNYDVKIDLDGGGKIINLDDDEQNKGSIKDDVVSSVKSTSEIKDREAYKKLGQTGREDKQIEQKPFFEEFITKEDDEKTFPFIITFDATAITDVVPAFAQILDFNYLIDPQVKGAVTMTVNCKMNKREVWEVFEQILWLSGAYCSLDDNVVHILPFSKMPQERRIFAEHPPRANVEVELLPVRNAASKDVLERIKPFLTEGATAMDIPHQNSILLVEAPSNIPKIRSLVKMLDRKNKAEWPQMVIRCENVSAARIKTELAAILPVLGFPVTMDNVEAEPGSIHLVGVDRLQVIVASAANQEALDELKQWIAVLDQSNVGDQERIFIYKVINGKADELMQAVSAIFPTTGSTLSPKSTSSGSSDSSNSSGSSSNSGVESLKNIASKSTKSSSKVSQDGEAGIFDVPVTVFADAVQNRLVIKTKPRTYAMIKALLNRLDTVPSQVLLQVVVSEVTLSDSNEFGLEFSDKQSSTAQKVDSIFGTNYSSLNPGSATDYGFTYYLTKFNNPDDKFAYVKALAGKGKLNVISSPQIAVVSHSQAKISVGDRVPIITNEITDTASTSATSTAVARSVQYEDTGVILTVTPHVTKGGLISMELKQEVSDVFPNKTSDIDSPVIRERVVETTLSIRDGSTLIVAGLIKESKSDNLSSVPMIADVPFLGRLLGSSEIEKEKTELVILITGKIITEQSKLEVMTKRYRQAMRAIIDLNDEQKLKPVNSVD
jgi:type II secretion system protein D